MYIKKILWAIALLGLVIMGVIAFYIYNAMFVPNTSFEEESVMIKIPSGSSYLEARTILEPLLDDIGTFDALASRKKYTSNVRAGRYRIKKGMTNNDIINAIRSQNIPLTLAFNNQNSLGQLAGRVGGQIEADSISLIRVMQDSVVMQGYGFNKATALGMYLPNSYEFFWNTSDIDFVKRMYKEYQRFWNESRLERAKHIGLNPDEVMTLASIVYEESKVKDEQPRVAGVYLNRLKIGMPLQADPALKFWAYQLPKYQNTVIRRVLNEHKAIDSPYNTYMYAGLPPGLICMPDISAIDAVLNSEDHDFFYFAADPDRLGYHRFAKTLSEHNRNARAYHRYLDSQGIRR
ncbi:MAG: endolytic transglycosylase MltG [Bacteroidota bacterium]